MFDKKLFEISESIVESINVKEIEKRNKQIEKQVLDIIQKHSDLINEDGISVISVRSRKNAYDYNEEYAVLKSIIESGRQKYFEDEYSLYFISDVDITAYSSACSVINFAWNALEYNKKNKTKARARKI